MNFFANLICVAITGRVCEEIVCQFFFSFDFSKILFSFIFLRGGGERPLGLSKIELVKEVKATVLFYAVSEGQDFWVNLNSLNK